MEELIDDSLLMINYKFSCKDIKKAAIFDFDSTLCKFYGNKRIKKWDYQYEAIPRILRDLHRDDYSLIILSNESLLIEKNLLDKFKAKITEFIKDINLPFLVFAALKKDKYRKPSIGVFKYLNKFLFNDLEDIFYVGDAAGPRKGFYSSYCDIKFAYNCGIKFYTPEQYFLSDNKSYDFKRFDVSKYKNREFIASDSKFVFVYGINKYNGRSFFVKKYYPNYVLGCSDEIKENCVYINCNDLELIKKIEKRGDVVFYFLDYEKRIVEWLKSFSYVSGLYSKKTFVPVEEKVIKYLDNKLIKVPFIFDDSFYDEEVREIACLEL